MINQKYSKESPKKIYSRVHKAGILTLFVGVVVISILGGQMIRGGLVIESSLQALFPKNETKKILQQATEKLFSSNGNKAIFLFSGIDEANTIRAAKSAIKTIENSGKLRLLEQSTEQQKIFELVQMLTPVSFHFLSDEHRKQLSEKNISSILIDARKNLFDFISNDGVLPLNKDPLGLFNTWFSESYIMPSHLQFLNGLLFVHDKSSPEKTSILVLMEIPGDALSIELMSHVSQVVEEIKNQSPSGVNLYMSGMIFHAAEASKKAKSDMMLVAAGSTLGIIILFLFSFRTPKPLLISLGSIFFGCVSATIVCHSYYGQLHIFTLVFGASLIGVTVDYSLHFFVRIYYQNQINHPLNVMGKIIPEISTGVITSAIGFGCLLFSTLPGLDQIALFSISGLVSSWLFVTVVYPILNYTPGVCCKNGMPGALAPVANFPLFVYSRLGGKVMFTATILMMFSMVLLLTLIMKESSDVRSLHNPSSVLAGSEKKISKMLSRASSNQYFIIVGDSPDLVLTKEEEFRNKLDRLVKSSVINSYEAVSDYMPSRSRQQNNYQLIKDTFYSEEKILENFMREVGFSQQYIKTFSHLFEQQSEDYLSMDSWLKHVPDQIAALWLGPIGDGYGSIIALHGINNLGALSEAAIDTPGVIFSDNIENISSNLSSQRQQASHLLIFAYLVVAALMVIRYRSFGALILVVIPLTSSLLTLAALSLFGVAINLFHIFGLFLILGLGMDYGIFISSPNAGSGKTYIAVFLSATTSCLSFGLLSLSSIPMIHAFGTTILLGSVFNLILVPLALSLNHQHSFSGKYGDV